MDSELAIVAVRNPPAHIVSADLRAANGENKALPSAARGANDENKTLLRAVHTEDHGNKTFLGVAHGTDRETKTLLGVAPAPTTMKTDLRRIQPPANIESRPHFGATARQYIVETKVFHSRRPKNFFVARGIATDRREDARGKKFLMSS